MKKLNIYPYPHRYPVQVQSTSQYLDEVMNCKTLNDQAGFDGILLFTSLDDPFDQWTLGGEVFRGSQQVPIVAVMPGWEHPVVTARKLETLQTIYQRPCAVNWITGLNLSDHEKLGAPKSKPVRFEMLNEYMEIVMRLQSGEKLTFSGKHYQVKGHRLTHFSQIQTKHYISGSVENFDSTLSKYPALVPVSIGLEKGFTYSQPVKGVGLGIIARSTEQEARQVMEMFLGDKKISEKYIEMSKKNTDSIWKKRLFDRVDHHEGINGFYASALKGFSQVGFFVHSYEACADYLLDHIQNGRDHFFISLVSSKEILHIKKVFDWVKNKI